MKLFLFRYHLRRLSSSKNLTCRIFCSSNPRHFSAAEKWHWRKASALDEWVQREARPVSLRQLTVFGRSLTEARLIVSANYARTELPTRIAHRLRDMQTLPYVVLTNLHMAYVYELYNKAFDVLRCVPEIMSIDDNDKYCEIVRQNVQEHLTVIPKLVMGVLQCQDVVKREVMDDFMNRMLKSRISRRVIAEQHLTLTKTFHSSRHIPSMRSSTADQTEFVGEVFLRCNAREVVERCAAVVQALSRQTYSPDTSIPEVRVHGHTSATLTYIPSHLEYIVGELLRNSVQAVVERGKDSKNQPAPIEVLICEAPQHVILRVSDQGGGIPPDVLPHLWSFVKGSGSHARLENLNKVPQLSATLEEIKVPNTMHATGGFGHASRHGGSLRSLSGRPPDLRLGIGLPISRVYAEYWAGSLELHSMEGYGVDAFLQISKLGNKNEQLSTRATMDSL